MSVVRVVRTFGDVQLERLLVLVVSPMPGMLLNLGTVAAGGVLAIQQVILVPRDDGPGVFAPGVVVLLASEPPGSIDAAREAGWRDPSAS